MLYTFLLPAYKAEFLCESIESILAQTYKDFELLIVDDCSPYQLEKVVEPFLSDERVFYYRNDKNIGGKDLVAQWNHCLKYAKGDYVILASDDDIYHLNYLHEINNLVQRYPQTKVFGCRKRIINEFGQLVDVDGCLNEYMTTTELAYRLYGNTFYSSIPNYAFHRETLIALGGFVSFPVAWYSDDATLLAMARKGGIAFSSKLLFSFRFSGINLSTVRNRLLYEKKLVATKEFYQWNLIQFDLWNNRDEVDCLLKSRLEGTLNNYLSYKTRLLVMEAGGWALIYLLRNRREIPFVSVKWCVKLTYSYIKKFLKRI